MARDEGNGSEIAESAAAPVLRHFPRRRKRLYVWIDLERLRPVRPIDEVGMVTDTPVGVLRVIMILPSRLDVAGPHR